MKKLLAILMAFTVLVEVACTVKTGNFVSAETTFSSGETTKSPAEIVEALANDPDAQAIAEKIKDAIATGKTKDDVSALLASLSEYVKGQSFGIKDASTFNEVIIGFIDAVSVDAGALDTAIGDSTIAQKVLELYYKPEYDSKGDVNRDGYTTSSDALEILRYIVGMIPEIDTERADVNSDSKVNSTDALEVLKIVVGLVTPSNPSTPTTTNRIEMPMEEVYNRLAAQRRFGFNKAYDSIAGIGNFFLDSITAYFEYDDKYWLIEFWKGEYAFGAVGCEIGFYTTEKNSTNTYTYENRGPEWLIYKSVEDGDAMKVSMKMWQYQTPEQTTPVQKIDYNIDQPHWWSADFATGLLYKNSDRTTLVMVGSILFPNATIKNLFVNAMKEKGFTEGTINTYHNVETLQVEGNKVTVCWKNYADAHQVSRNS